MDIKDYFERLNKGYESAFETAALARSRGYDPERFVEIKLAPDIASRVEGIIGISGLADTIRSMAGSKTHQELAFDLVKEICTNPKFEMDRNRRLTLAVRVGLSVITEGILVAPTEGLQGVEVRKNPDGSDHIAVLYAGPIRGAGGTGAALSVALADYGRKTLGIGEFKCGKKEVERYLEEIQLYHSRIARLQYYPSEADIRVILENCPVCIDGLPTEQMEVSIHRNLTRLDGSGKEVPVTNRIRGGIGLVVCEGIAQKAKSVLKHTKNAGLDWSWLNNIIKVEKATGQAKEKKDPKSSVFLQELVAGRPILAYPDYQGAFRLRYGRSRMTGIAAKGFSPATMIVLDEFIATGTQLKMDSAGKGCVATPVDSIEGPFVKLATGEAFRVNDAKTAREVKDRVAKIISVGDILITLGDFKKSNAQLKPSSYTEEFWYDQLKAKGYAGPMLREPSFRVAYDISKKYGVPMHPLYIYDYDDVKEAEMISIARALSRAKVDGEEPFGIKSVEITGDDARLVRDPIERLCVPHHDSGESITIKADNAQALLCSFGFATESGVDMDRLPGWADDGKTSLEMINMSAPFTIMRRASRIGARIGRPEKARERLMKPAPNILYPIGENGGKERSLFRAYSVEKKKFKVTGVELDIARFVCSAKGETLESPYCARHNSAARIVRLCANCKAESDESVCRRCGGRVTGYETRNVDVARAIDEAAAKVGVQSIPKNLKGVKGLSNRDRMGEPIEKGILRALYNIHIFKDGTARFDATDVPITHVYPSEIGTPIDRLRELGYTHDYEGKELESDGQLLEMRHQDVIINRKCAHNLLNTCKFVDDLLVKFYKAEPFYKANGIEDLIGHLVITLSPHTSAGVLCRIIGFTDANVGFAHPYVICARRRNCDGDEDTTMMLMDALVNFSKHYLPTTIGGTMDAPLILTANVLPEEVDDEVWAMETINDYGLEFYEKTMSYPYPGEVSIENVGARIGSGNAYSGIGFTQYSGATSVVDAPKSSVYTKLNTMKEKIDLQFSLVDRLCSVDKRDSALRLIISHFIPDLIGNMHSFSKQSFRCVSCNAKYRRVPLVGKCTKCEGKLVLTISKGGIEKYLDTAANLAEKYNLDPYIRQRIALIRDEIETVFGGVGGGTTPTRQFNLSKFM
ncbi:MAG: DNA polymerase II large subunit [Candidatus Micrarchaeota archaeon]|nr:DNA polymerase II large subunit [Candidatus Micrarchaeota archaeon]